MSTMRSRTLVICLMALLASLFSQAALARQAGVALGAPDTAAEQEFLQLINEERRLAGREPLVYDADLHALARAKAEDMALQGYFDHVSPTYGTVFDMLAGEGIGYRWAGENIARAGSVESAHQALMQSPEHRANILSAGYTHVGIGVYRVGSRLHVAQVFLRPRA